MVVEGLKRERVKCCVVVCCVDMIFTRNNVQRAVRGVWTGVLGDWLHVPQRRQREIESQFRGNDGQVKKKYVDYFMDHDPLASWRRVIVVLDELKYWGEEGAEKIRHLAEDVTGEGR